VCPSLNAFVPAIANALFDAVGVRVWETPIVPEEVWRELGR